MLFISVGFILLFCQTLAEELEEFEGEGEDDAEFEEDGYSADCGAVEFLRRSVGDLSAGVFSLRVEQHICRTLP